jgi:RNA recognition motif-containing protein
MTYPVALTIHVSVSLLQRYGYVQFEKQEDANKAVETVNGMMLGGSAVSVEHYMPRSQRRKCVLALLFIVIFKGSPASFDVVVCAIACTAGRTPGQTAT